jgi:CHAD domain-containing protein
MGGTSVVNIRHLLKRCLRASATLRDADVMLVFVDKLLPEYPELRKFRRHLRRRQRRATQSAQRRLKHRARKLSRRVRALAAEIDGPAKAGHSADVVSRALRESADDVRDLSLAAHRDGTQLHRARVALKRLRYMVEALGDLLPGAEKSWADALRRAQHAMGEINDLEVLGARMVKYTARRPHERRRLRSANAAVALRQRQLRRKFEASPPPVPVRLRHLLTRIRKAPANFAG